MPAHKKEAACNEGVFQMKSPLRILHLEDEPLDCELVESALDRDGIACKIFRVETSDDFIEAIDSGGFDIIFADHSLPGFDGLSALAIAKERCPGIPFIFISGTMGEELAIETLKRGAKDYVLKDRISRLAPSVRRALEEVAEKLERMKAIGYPMSNYGILPPICNLPGRKKGPGLPVKYTMNWGRR